MAHTIEWDPVIAIQHAIWESGESQRDLADKLGWSEARLSKILSRKQRLLVDDLTDISEAQGRDYGWYVNPPVSRLAKNRVLVTDILGLTTHHFYAEVA